MNSDLSEKISRSVKPVTVLFTDIENSTRYWDQYGDIKGRMMLDQHNRLIFPIIKKYRGKVIKTIGDGLMALFKNSEAGLKAAIGIQQAMERMRRQDPNFTIKIRVGLHTGNAIVEEKDVYGDTVNVAARLADEAAGDEIIISDTAVTSLREGKKYSIFRKGSFTPKGKQHTLTLYSCRWNEYKQLIGALRFSSGLELEAHEKGDIAVYLIFSIVSLFYIYLEYLRYLLIDIKKLPIMADQALLTLNPWIFFEKNNLALSVLVLAVLSACLLILKIKNVPYFYVRMLRGGFWFSLVFFIVHIPVVYFKVDYGLEPGKEIYKSKYEFVQVNKSDAALIQEAPRQSSIKRVFQKRTRLILAKGATNQGGKIWQKVYLGKDIYGWIREKDLSIIWVKQQKYKAGNYFYFRFLDLCAIIAAIGGFVLGFSNFSIRPR